MKFFVVLAVLAFTGYAVNAEEISLSDEQKAKVIQFAGECIQQEQVTKEAVTALRQGQFENADKNLKCFTNCFLEKVGMLKNGEVQRDVITAKLGGVVGAEKLNKIQNECNGLKGADNCETAFELFKCYYKNKGIAV